MRVIILATVGAQPGAFVPDAACCECSAIGRMVRLLRPTRQEAPFGFRQAG